MKIKGMTIKVKFGAIEAEITDPNIDPDNISRRDYVKLIRANVKTAADQVINIQDSLRHKTLL